MFSTPRRRHIGWTLLSVCAAVVILGTITVLVVTLQIATEVRATQLEGTPTGQKLLASADRILDCTDPEGECFKRSQDRQADVVGNINEVAVFAAACAAGLPDGLTDQQRVIRVQRCLIDQLAADED